jgi:hypothetical protein
MVMSSADEHYALLDPPTGAIEQEFPTFGFDNAYLSPMDLDNDGRFELFFGKFGPPLNTAYDWTPSGYVTMFSNTDPLEGHGSAHLRNPGLTEIVEFGPNDLRIRNSAGFVIFRASTDLPGWTGVNRDAAVLDVNDNGVSELLAVDAVAVRLLEPVNLLAVPGSGDGRGFVLLANAPNPFRAGTAIRFVTPAAGDVSVRVLDAGGRLVRRLDGHMNAGPQEIRWDGKDDRGRAVPSGLWFYEITANGARLTGRMVRLGS